MQLFWSAELGLEKCKQKLRNFCRKYVSDRAINCTYPFCLDRYFLEIANLIQTQFSEEITLSVSISATEMPNFYTVDYNFQKYEINKERKSNTNKGLSLLSNLLKIYTYGTCTSECVLPKYSFNFTNKNLSNIMVVCLNIYNIKIQCFASSSHFLQ